MTPNFFCAPPIFVVPRNFFVKTIKTKIMSLKMFVPSQILKPDYGPVFSKHIDHFKVDYFPCTQNYRKSGAV